MWSIQPWLAKKYRHHLDSMSLILTISRNVPLPLSWWTVSQDEERSFNCPVASAIVSSSTSNQTRGVHIDNFTVCGHWNSQENNAHQCARTQSNVLGSTIFPASLIFQGCAAYQGQHRPATIKESDVLYKQARKHSFHTSMKRSSGWGAVVHSTQDLPCTLSREMQQYCRPTEQTHSRTPGLAIKDLSDEHDLLLVGFVCI